MHYEFWDGRSVFKAEQLAFDTETEVVESIPKTCPRIVLATASDGERSVVLRPEKLADFIVAHHQKTLVGHNFAFDVLVVSEYLRSQGAHDVGSDVLSWALGHWWAMADADQFRDTMLLDQLVRLAEGVGESAPGEGKLFPRNLGQVSKAYGCLELDKTDPYRMRFAELWAEPDWQAPHLKVFFDYAVADTVATAQIYLKMREKALGLARRHGVSEELIAKYGVLTEAIQVKASIALLQVSRNGLRVDLEKALALEAEKRAEHASLLLEIEAMHPELLKRYKKKNDAGYKYTKKSHTPQWDQKVLRVLLEKIAVEELGVPAPRSNGKLKLVSISEDDWAPYSDRHPFLKAWRGLTTLGQQLKLFNLFHEGKGLFRNDVESLHCRYNVLLRTGRVSAEDPNITGIPKEGEVRGLFIASPGKKLITCDFSFLELRTLAAVCESRYGWSTLADTIREERDPHCHTASMVKDMTYDEFRELEKTDPKTYKAHRQSSKIVNFGIGGGMGAPKLVLYAKNNYGVTMSLEDATFLREKIINEVYPELKLYLGDTSLEDLCRALVIPLPESERLVNMLMGCNKDKHGMMLYCMSKVARGEPYRKDGGPFDPQFVARLWRCLEALIETSGAPEARELLDAVRRRDGSKSLHEKLFLSASITLTGRVRGRCSYTQKANSPFQGLASDGAKLALWELLRSGFLVRAFVHDEVVVEVKATGAEQQAQEVEAILNRNMESVMGTVPSACSWKIADHWAKG